MEIELDPEWAAWMKESLDTGCDPEEVLGILLGNNLPTGAVKKAIDNYFHPNPNGQEGNTETFSPADYKALANVRLTQETGKNNAVRFPDDRIQLYTIDNFLNSEDCDDLVALIQPNMKPSKLVGEGGVNTNIRDSSTCNLDKLHNPLVEKIHAQITEIMGINPNYCELLQGQQYKLGQQYKPHHDFFFPGIRYGQKSRGNRTWTFMIYLNDVEEGGGTHFVHLGHTIMPRRGKAVAWNNWLDIGTPNFDTLHAGLPVTKGSKTIITKWFREYGHGPALLD